MARRVARPAASKHRRIVQQIQGSFTESKHILRGNVKSHKNTRIMKAIAASNDYIETNQYTLENLVSGENAWSSTYFGDQESLARVGSQALSIAGQDSVGQPANLQQAPSRFLLEHVQAKYQFINRTNTPVSIDVYFLRPKFDTADLMTYVSPYGVTYSWSGPQGAVQVGVAASAGNTSASPVNYFTPGIEPKDSSIFREYFVTHDHITLQLSVGGIHTLDVGRTYNQVCGAEHYSNSTLNYLRDFSEILLFKAVGCPVVDSIGLENVTTAPVKIAWTETVKYQYTVVNNSVHALLDINALPQAPLTTNPLTTMNAAQGAAEAVGKF